MNATPFRGRPVCRLTDKQSVLVVESIIAPPANSAFRLGWLFKGEPIETADGNAKYQVLQRTLSKERYLYIVRVRRFSLADIGTYSIIASIGDQKYTRNIRCILDTRFGEAPALIPTGSCTLHADRVPGRTRDKKLYFRFKSGTKPHTKWFVAGREINAVSEYAFHIQPVPDTEDLYDSSLIIPPTNRESAIISCVISNQFGQIRATYDLKSSVVQDAAEFPEPPQITEEHDAEGRHVTVVRVKFRVNVPFTVTWTDPRRQPIGLTDPRRQISQVSDANDVHTAQLRISRYLPTDSGDYVCRIRNTVGNGSAVADITLNFEDSP